MNEKATIEEMKWKKLEIAFRQYQKSVEITIIPYRDCNTVVGPECSYAAEAEVSKQLYEIEKDRKETSEDNHKTK